MKTNDLNKKLNAASTRAVTKKNKAGLALFWIMLILGIAIMLTILKVRNFSLWFITSLFLWFSYLYNIKRSISIGLFSFTKMVIFGIVVLTLSMLIIFT